MFLLVDGCPLQTPARDRGIGRYTSALLAGLRAVRPDWRIHVVEHGRLPSIPPDRVHGLTIDRFDAPLPYDLSAEPNRVVNDRYYADWLLTRRADHILFASVFEKLGVVPNFVGRRPPTSAVMYDLIPVLFPAHYGILQQSEKWYARRLRDAAAVDALFAISEAAAVDTRMLLGAGGAEVINVQGAVDPRFDLVSPAQMEAVAAPVRSKFGIDKPFVLYVGGPDYRKNLSGAVAGFAALPPSLRAHHQLVIACFLPDELRSETLQTAERLGIGGQVVCTGFVSDEELIALYQTCRVFFFPSLYEGLGLPVLEALRCGAPVACSNVSSMPEFAGDVSRTFNPYDPQSMAGALAETLEEPAERRVADRVAFARSFTWEKTAEAVARGIETSRPAEKTGRPRVAWVAAELPSTLPGTPDSIDFLNEIARHCEVELVLRTRDVPAWLSSCFLVLTEDEVEDRHEADPFDVFALHVGPPGPDPFVLATAARHSGLIVLNHPDPTQFRSGETWRMLTGAAGVVVRSVTARRWVRTMTDTPVTVTPHPFVSDLTGRLFAAAVEDTAARLDSSDTRWFDTVANALAAVPGPLPTGLFADWTSLRHEARQPVRPALFIQPGRTAA